MKPEKNSNKLLGITRSKAKMYEYSVPAEHHINIAGDPSRLIILAVAIVGELSARINSEVADNKATDEIKNDLQFSAQFFDAYLNSKLNSEIDSYLILIASSSYYLCDLPGSSQVLVERVQGEIPDLDAEYLEDILMWLLKGNYTTTFVALEGRYTELLTDLTRLLGSYYKSGNNIEKIIGCLNAIREIAYNDGNSRELLFADIIGAITRVRLSNSTWNLLPKYTDLSINEWRAVITKKRFVRELWPSQRMLGEGDVFRGKSAIIQMPTSAGKTKSIEIIIRSAFLTGRASMVVVVAPFRALCHEIRANLADAFEGEDIKLDEISDVMQIDFVFDFEFDSFDLDDMSSAEVTKSILVVTPEKLMYMLRQNPKISESIGLLIYDEGHQFDSGIRGITYELLLASLKSLIVTNIQTVLISAVISNADEINGWLNGETGVVISGNNLLPTYRTIAFTSWLTQLGRLEFVEPSDPEINQFYVPRLMQQIPLNFRGREKKFAIFQINRMVKAFQFIWG